MIARMEMSEVIRRHRTVRGLSQADLAALVGVDKRQIRRYEAGDTQPTLSVGRAIASALGISLDELAGEEPHRVAVDGYWWACWQTWTEGVEGIYPHRVEITQRDDTLEIVAVTQGAPAEHGGYRWRGEMRVFDNEAVIGWYAAKDGAVRSKGSMYFRLHPHGLHMTGRWVGLSYDGPLVSGWGAIARTEDEVLSLMNRLRASGSVRV
jgi:transcriptional regulator with XRE-family HTH domain